MGFEAVISVQLCLHVLQCVVLRLGRAVMEIRDAISNSALRPSASYRSAGNH